jgi:hypothetical protein
MRTLAVFAALNRVLAQCNELIARPNRTGHLKNAKVEKFLLFPR